MNIKRNLISAIMFFIAAGIFGYVAYGNFGRGQSAAALICLIAAVFSFIAFLFNLVTYINNR